ncbi:hypothetical protein QR680_016506 [Steinernema hermaphroditum]|uniref:Globin family profile domain-containing protein n=1 Tax=Steinernema hermaphroditum TaxID=289476 RepID=A0AA39HBF1_9BILA|nr:hypothetical protein QR680_016506 [Steinernema hermaphroditum]
MGCALLCPPRSEKNKINSECQAVVKKSGGVSYDLTREEKQILRIHWESTVLAQQPDLFLKTMRNSIDDSPKMLDVISCRMHDPNYENIEEWPKLIKMTKGNCAFFTKQIVFNQLEEAAVRKDSEMLGAIHIQYAPYGFKPTFLDIWQKHMVKNLEEVEFHTSEEKRLFIAAFSKLSTFLCTLMVVEYEDSMKSVRHGEKEIKKAETKIAL